MMGHGHKRVQLLLLLHPHNVPKMARELNTEFEYLNCGISNQD